MLYTDDVLARMEAALQAVLPRWGLPESAGLRLLAISENATFVAEEPGSDRRIVVRVHRPGYHGTAEILSELAWIEALRADGAVAVPRPIAARDGALLVSYAEGALVRAAVAFEFMPGGEPAIDGDLVGWYGRLGAITARLHRHSRRWRRPRGFTRKRWDFETIIGAGARWGDWRRAPGLDPAGRRLLERLSGELAAATAAYGSGPERFGLIHCDMRLANLLVEDDRLGVIDFDDCGFSWFAYDFAAAVSFIEHEPVVPELMAAWLAGYLSVARLAEADVAALPLFVMLRRMQLTAWIASHAETPTAEAAGGPAFTAGTLALAERFLTEAPAGIGR